VLQQQLSVQYSRQSLYHHLRHNVLIFSYDSMFTSVLKSLK